MQTEYITGHEADETPVYDLGTLPTDQTRRLLHVEKRGPAFSHTATPANPAQALAWQALGRALYALERRCLRDLIPAWERVRAELGLTFQVDLLPQPFATAMPTFDGVRVTLAMALSHAGDPHEAYRHWRHCDTVIRKMARLEAQVLVLRAARMTDEDMLEDGWSDEDIAFHAQQVAYFTRFANGEAA